MKLANTKSFFIQCKRVWQITRKPTIEEIKTTAKVSAIGIGIIGFIGFLIYLIFSIAK